jgi:hypothetical protein
MSALFQTFVYYGRWGMIGGMYERMQDLPAPKLFTYSKLCGEQVPMTVAPDSFAYWTARPPVAVLAP